MRPHGQEFKRPIFGIYCIPTLKPGGHSGQTEARLGGVYHSQVDIPAEQGFPIKAWVLVGAAPTAGLSTVIVTMIEMSVRFSAWSASAETPHSQRWSDREVWILWGRRPMA